jgi:acyl-homoserine lactone acylase PvdQ
MRKIITITIILFLISITFSVIGISLKIEENKIMKNNKSFGGITILDFSYQEKVGMIPENEVHIYRDIYGIPHIYGGSNYAMFYGEGYAHAEDHLEQMLINYRTVTGRMSEVFGRDYLSSDILMRLLRVVEIVKEKYSSISSEAKESVEAFAEGINYYMTNHPEAVPEWATPVTPQEVVSWGKMIMLSRPLGRLYQDIQRGFRTKIDIGFQPEIFESNEWVVAPEKTVEGYAMLQIDPHLQWYGSNAWYEVHLESNEYHVAGSTLWGVPGVMLGHNDRIAWAFTANSPDTADAYLEKLNPLNKHQYKYDGEWLDLKIIQEIIHVAGQEPFQIELIYSHHGPIFYQLGMMAISGKLSSWEDVGFIDQILAYNRAKNLNEFKQAISKLQLVRWNHVYGDIEGNIFYIWNGRIFHRKGNYDYTRPVDGSTSNTEWGELVQMNELPQETNPESKFIQNCNNAPWFINPLTTIKEEDFPSYIANGGINARGIRSTNLLDSDSDIELNEMIEYSLDNFALNAEILIPLLIFSYYEESENVSDPNNWLSKSINILENWDYNLEVDSEEVALARIWTEEIYNNFGGIDLLNPDDTSDLTVQEMRGALELLIKAAKKTDNLYGTLRLQWGDIHVLQRGDNIYPLSGGGHIFTPLHMSHGDIDENGVMYCDRGSSYMMLVQLSNPVKAWSQFPISESNDPNDIHYYDISELYSRDEYKPAWFTKQDVLNNLDPIDPNPLILTIAQDNNPPFKPDINGHPSGCPGNEYLISIFTTDPNNDKIFYYIDWGDGNNSGWFGPYNSGAKIAESYIWYQQGTYFIKIKAKDINYAESDWATLEISMPKNKLFNRFNPLILGLIQRSSILKFLI